MHFLIKSTLLFLWQHLIHKNGNNYQYYKFLLIYFDVSKCSPYRKALTALILLGNHQNGAKNTVNNSIDLHKIKA